MIPALIRKMIGSRSDSQEAITLWGDGSPSREYLYVDDCAEGFLLAAEHYDGAEPVNLGTGVETTIRETAELVAELTGFSGEIHWDSSMPNGQPRRSLDASRAKREFGFEAKTMLREGLEQTHRLVPRAGARCRRACGFLSAPGRSGPGSSPTSPGASSPLCSPSSGSRLLGLAFSVHHNGWLFYQGGDQTFYWTDAHLLTKWTLPFAAVGYAWSYMLMPIALVAGANVLSGLPAVVLLNTLVLLPVALLCVYGIGTRIAGRVFGYWAALLWVVVPYAAIPMFDHRYHQKYVEITLPQQFGLDVSPTSRRWSSCC